MAYQNVPGGGLITICASPIYQYSSPSTGSYSIDNTNECMVFAGQIITEDGSSHTIDTTGSSSLGWRNGTTTFANGGTTVKVGLAPVSTGGPPVRADNTADAINFDVFASFTGGGGGITGDAWQTSVPTSGTKTVANGDVLCFAVQMTARGGADSITGVASGNIIAGGYPATTLYNGSYTATGGVPNCIITFSDGALGWFHGGVIFNSYSNIAWNSSSSPNEYGQLYSLPFPCKIHGMIAYTDYDAATDLILYSDPLGTPSAEKSVTVNPYIRASTSTAPATVYFGTAYTLAANTPVVAAVKPTTTTNSTITSRVLASATHRVADCLGTGYGVSRSSGAFANHNSSLTHFPIGLLVSAFDDGTSTGSAGVIGS